MMHVPVATYRVQFTPTFGFVAGARVVPYLSRLGISDLFVSPVSQARPGSTHGYDVIDHNEINPELGGSQGLHSLRRAVESHGMAWLQDIVPNHMAFDKRNAKLADVLERGRSSPLSTYFDIDWSHQYESLRGRVLAPFLGSFYAEALENGEISLEYNREGLGVHYYDQRYPIALHTYRRVLAHDIERLEQRLGAGHGELVRFLGALHFLATIAEPRDEQQIPVEEIEHAKLMVWDSYERNEEIAAFVRENIAVFNGKDGRWDLLDGLLSEQWYRLSFWKVASDEINYRRFFTVNDLICIHVSRLDVFEESHRLIAQLVEQGVFQGLRVDHIDGISDPQSYLDRLRRLAPNGYLVVEKVLGSHEALPNAWPVQGTTGYDFLDKVNGVFVRCANEREITRTYARFIGESTAFDNVLRARKRLMVGKHFAGNIENLAYRLKRIAGEERYGRDITMYALKRAMVEVMVHFPVYRTYVSERGFSSADREILHQAVSAARRAFPEMAYELYFIEQYLFHPMLDEDTGDERKEELVAFVNEFQQLTGPLMAKGCEDTAFYVYNRLISLNEVGGDPGEFGT
ncbi:MAG: malto-oligosyltrehalose synthase, partial [Chitinivibrionales bacterium]|nr:malto-oligosyltrehalose synthase [Chitinivibrionales bacterium]